MSIYYSILYFFVYGFLGWCTEVIFAAFKQHRFVNRGFLNGPICPIYGVGVTLVIACLEAFQSNLLLLYREALAAVISSLLQLSGWQSEWSWSLWEVRQQSYWQGFIVSGFWQKKETGKRQHSPSARFYVWVWQQPWCLETHGLRGFYQDRLMSAKVLFQCLPEQFQLCFVISGFQFRECL